MADLVLGPMLRHVGRTTATIWVETDTACTVEILGHAAHTWQVAGHHYAIVCIEGLERGSETPYDVRLDGQRVWPLPDSPHPASRIRTVDPDHPLRLVFGSCRFATSTTVGPDKRFDDDALDAYAQRLAAQVADEHHAPADWPDALVMLGDQVYADEVSPATRQFIRARRDVSQPPYEQVADFEEYTQLYHESWTDPNVRWLLSTVPTSMIFDDHDVRDDWNTSDVWRRKMRRTSWWEERIIGGLMSYWVYQHLGNLGPEALAKDKLYQQVQQSADAEEILRDFAARADREADGFKGAQWSYRRDFGRIRLLVIDSRCGRILEGEHRSMVDENEFRWIEDQLVDEEYDHLLVGTSLPWLLPRAMHDLESWDEALAGGSRGRLLAWFGEWVRQKADFEHWAAFRESFVRLAGLLARVGGGEHGATAPATICVLSGDVHHVYVAEAHYPQPLVSRVFQLTCSPVHNHVPPAMQAAFRIFWSDRAERVTRWLSRFARVPDPPLSWRRTVGPYFGHELATLELSGRSARLLVEKTGSRGEGGRGLTEVATLELASDGGADRFGG